MISGINLDTKSVTVEWYENGETKGKEVHLNEKRAFLTNVLLLPYDCYTIGHCDNWPIWELHPNLSASSAPADCQ